MAITYVFNPFTGEFDAVDGTGSGSTADHNHTGTGDGGELTNDLHDGYIDLQAISTPSNPAVNIGRIFTRTSGSNIELVWRSVSGAECIICTIDNTAAPHVNRLPLNWIE